MMKLEVAVVAVVGHEEIDVDVVVVVELVVVVSLSMFYFFSIFKGAPKGL